MIEKKARLVGVCKGNRFDHHAWEHTELMYEYRGHTYFVTKDNNGYMGETMAMQHRKAQQEIDEKIERVNRPIPAQKYEGSAQEGFDLFWEYVEGDSNEL